MSHGEAESGEYELLILHTAEGQEWATYLQQILRSSKKFHKRSIMMYAVGPADQLHGYSFECFHSSRCIVLLLTGTFLDMLEEPELQAALHRLLYPPHRVVVLLCGISEDDLSPEVFGDWQSWRKLYAEDEPARYVSAILESIADSTQQDVAKDEEQAEEKSANEDIRKSTQLTCLTVQPARVLCGEEETLFIVFAQKVDDQLSPEVEFSLEGETAERVPGTVENEYTISVTAPDMPAGVVSLTLHTAQSSVGLTSVTYFTSMGEVSRYLENATDPVNFICQAFSLTSNTTETLDIMLTNSLKSKMPATSLQLFGIRQIEEENMAAYQRDEELPTLLHFAAKFGLKKLTTILLQCPGALQAYSVMNKYGDYPNTLAEKSGFSDLRQFMDEFVETADMLKSHLEDTVNTEEIYEYMSTTSQDIMMKYSGCSEDIYESMLGIDPECADDLCKVFIILDLMMVITVVKLLLMRSCEKDNQNELKQIEEEDPYKLCTEDIYDIVDDNSSYNSVILNRPPAPIPRSEIQPEPEQPLTYISRVAQSKFSSLPARPVTEAPTPVHDPYAGMKTPGQRQLISLQERVKVGEITVDEAVQEFKAWQFDHERRANSIRYQQENLKKLRDSITRRHKEREKSGKENWPSSTMLECAVYEATPRVLAPPPPMAQPIQRGNWKTGSTSSTSSESLRSGSRSRSGSGSRSGSMPALISVASVFTEQLFPFVVSADVVSSADTRGVRKGQKLNPVE
uniref:Phosphoinositide-3-kinase adaptor protein 1 n=1 Tax=Echeneis naucrates TaxID=173247 RepID=A0A665TKK9_ECHNA